VTRNACAQIRADLGAFIDRELPGVRMLRVADHLAACEPCASEVDALRSVGQMLRTAAERQPTPPAVALITDDVVELVRTEKAQSWSALLSRGFGDWRWALVGTGSLAATSVLALFVSAVLVLGPAPERDDSLAALISNLTSPSGMLFLEASPPGAAQDTMLIGVDNGATPQDVARDEQVMPAIVRLTEQQFVGQLTDAVTREGRLVELGSMPENERRYTEALLDGINRIRSSEPARGSTGSLNVTKIRWVTNTSVTAKGLN
jgi:hypothetical protein